MSSHSINQLQFDIRLTREADHLSLQTTLREAVYRYLLPALDEMLSAQHSSAEIILIDRLTLEIGELSDISQDKNWFESVCTQLQTKLVPLLSNGPGHDLYQLDREVAAQRSGVSRMNTTNNIESSEREGLNKQGDKIAYNNVQRYSPKQQAILQLTYYLQHGTLPWWCRQKNMTANLMSAMTEQREALFEMVLPLISHKGEEAHNICRRLVALLKNDLEKLTGLFITLAKVEQEYITSLNESLLCITSAVTLDRALSRATALLMDLLQSDSPMAQAKIISDSSSKNKQESDTLEGSHLNAKNKILRIEKNRFNQINKPLIEPSNAPFQRQSNTEHHIPESNNVSNTVHPAPQESSFYIDNAGLVLLWPFLTILFTRLQLSQGKQLEHRSQAMLVLHRLLYTQRPESEHELLLAKILCGQPLDQATPLDIALTIEQIKVIEELLLAAINYWVAIGKVSSAWLRQMFLHRSGVLKRQQHGWLLQVEGAPPDVLLNKLPWGISTIKLPWMPQPLTVQWAY